MRPLSFVIFILASASRALAADAGVVDLTSRGVIGDGRTLNTTAIQNAIDVCSSTGGGVLRFPAGHYVTGTIQLKDHVRIQLDDSAVLLGSVDPADYVNVDPFTAGDGVPLGYALIVANGASHVGIEGGGTIDGRGAELKRTQNPYVVRPFLIRWLRCTDVVVKGVRLTNPGAWTLNCFQCHDTVIDGVSIRTRTTGLANNDGIDLDSCADVRIVRCDIESGDDALCFKATSPLPCRNITATDCKLSTRCNAIKFGTESLGDFENITVDHCVVRNTEMAGIALYSVDGADMHGISISDIAMDGVTVPISIRLGARQKTFRAGQTARPVGQLREVKIRNIAAVGAKRIGILVNGVPGHPVENLTFENVRIELPGGGSVADAQLQLPEKEAAYPEMSMFGKVLPAYGLYLRHVRGLTFTNVQVIPTEKEARPAKILIDVQHVTPPDFAPEPNDLSPGQ